jgi:hypothetical protein
MTKTSRRSFPHRRALLPPPAFPLACRACQVRERARPRRHRHRRLDPDDRRVRLRGRGHQRRHQADYVKIVNDAGGIKGRKLRYVPEDTGYKVDVSMAAFKKITSQNKVNLYYGDSTGFVEDHQPRARPRRPDTDGGRVVCNGAQRPGQVPEPVPGRPRLHRADRHPAAPHRQGKAGRQDRLVYSDTEFGKDPIEAARSRQPRSWA